MNEGVDVTIKQIVVAAKWNGNFAEGTGTVDGEAACFMEDATRHAPLNEVAVAISTDGLLRDDCFG